MSGVKQRTRSAVHHTYYKWLCWSSLLRFIMASLLVTPFSPTLVSSNSCFSGNFFGNYRDGERIVSVLTVPDATCLGFWDTHLDSAHYSYSQAPQSERPLVWLERAAIDNALQEQQPGSVLEDLFLSLQTPNLYTQTLQEVISPSEQGKTAELDIHYRTTTAALVSISPEKARIIDTLLPPAWKSRLLPTTPVDYVPVPEVAVQFVREILSKLKFDPLVAAIVGNISIPEIQKDIRFLTGEDGKSGIISRHSFSTGALTAANWLKDRVEDTGATCRLVPFLVGFAPNVIWFVVSNNVVHRMSG
jgi:hypothetical protein